MRIKLLLFTILIAVLLMCGYAVSAESLSTNFVAVYYFHGNFRCVNCHNIEQYTKEAVEKYFRKELDSGKVVFKVINVEAKGAEHFTDDYQLYTKSVVLSFFAFSEKYQKRLADSGIPGSFSLGFIFALSFCPISAALFFGSLIPLALKSEFGLALPFIYGIGTGLPVVIFAVAIALGVTGLNHWFNRLTKLEYFMRKITGIVFVLIGLYYVSVYILKIL